jgi:hypothetical protein
MTSTTNPTIAHLNVPLPPGATYFDDWQGDGAEMPYRFIGSADWDITDEVSIYISAVQFADGRIDDGRISAPSVFVNSWHLPAEQVRVMISALQEALAQVEEWAKR